MKNLLFLVVFTFAKIVFSQSTTSTKHLNFQARSFEHAGKSLGYQILLPKDFNPDQAYPLHLFLHGAGERGDDNTSQLTHGSDLFIAQNSTYPAIVIFPQCPKDDYWAQVAVTRDTTGGENIFDFPELSEPTWAMSAVLSLMDEMVTKPYVDTARVYVGGLSMGGMGTFEVLYRRPNMFAAATPICGGGNPANTQIWATKTPVWIFHGEADNVVPVRYSNIMVEALLRDGAIPRISFYPNVGHNSWDNAFTEPDFFSWVYAQKRKDANLDCTPQWLKYEEAVLIDKYKEANLELMKTPGINQVVFMGDSITEGWLETSADFWQSHPNFINRGVSGQTTSQMLLRFRQDVIALNPKTVVILAGTNDIAGNTGKTSIATIANNLFSMADLAKSHQINVVLCSVLPVYDYPWEPNLQPANKIIDLNKLLSAYAKEQGHIYVDYHSAMKNPKDGMKKALSYDGVHCTAKGYQVMEDLLLRAL